MELKVPFFYSRSVGYNISYLKSVALELCNLLSVRLVDVVEKECIAKKTKTRLFSDKTYEAEEFNGFDYFMYVDCTAEQRELLTKLIDAYLLGRNACRH